MHDHHDSTLGRNRHWPQGAQPQQQMRHLHGHRYRFEAEISGELVGDAQAPDDGMVLDFGDVSRILTEEIHDVVDHAFLVQDTDLQGRAACEAMGPDHRTVVLLFPHCRTLGGVGLRPCGQSSRSKLR